MPATSVETTPSAGVAASAGVGQSAGILDNILERIRQGWVPDHAQLVAEYPEHASEIRQLMAVLNLIHAAADQADPGSMLEARVHVGRRRAVLGDFEIVRELARGGMGVVYEAVQGSLQRRVALKVLLPGASLSRQALERFDREARTAAALQHRHIVPVYATGTCDGVAYYVMPLIEGESLAAWFKAARAAPPPAGPARYRQVAEWGRQVAEALAYAHHCGVVHRDIKPSNLILDRSGAVWVADFGLARQDAHHSLTLSGDLIGTARYMSPEQARGAGSVDERCDIYALGATLYELVSLRPLFNGPDRESTLRQVLLEEPVPLRRLDRSIPEELAAIIHKALDKEPARRYQSAALLADDLGRFLAGQPTLARLPGPLQQLAASCRKHRLLVTALAAIMCALTAATVVSTRFAAQAWNAAGREADARAAAEQVSVFLRGMLATIDPQTARGREVSVREVLDGASWEIERAPQLPARVEAEIRATLGTTYHAIGRYAEALPHLRRALALSRDEVDRAARDGHDASPPNEQLAELLGQLGLLLSDVGDYQAAEVLLEEALTLRRRLHGERDPRVADALNRLALPVKALDRQQAATELLTKAMSIYEASPGGVPKTEEVATTLNNLAVTAELAGNYQRATVLVRESLSLRRTLFGDLHPKTAANLHNLAVILSRMGRGDDAIQLHREALTLRRSLYPEGHLHVADSLAALGFELRQRSQRVGSSAVHGAAHPGERGKTGTREAEEALRLFSESFDMRRRLLGDEHPAVSESLTLLASLHMDRGDLAAAHPVMREVLRRQREQFGPQHRDMAVSLNNLAAVLFKSGDVEAAEPLFAEVLVLLRAHLGDEHPLVGATMSNLAGAMLQQGQWFRAIPLYRQALADRRAQFPPSHPEVLRGLKRLSAALRAAGDAEGADQLEAQMRAQ